MCGIAGVLHFDGTAADPAMIARMTAMLLHRGPDDAGAWVSGPIGLGHRRLSIIDVAGSPQPMQDVSGRLHLSFNGEIFNYRELRSRLDYPFRTKGDTEVLLAALLRHGAGALSQLDGQFAFAVHDARDGSLLLARDRMGVLPLYYSTGPRLFAFASELKALLPALPRPPEVDREALAAYLANSSTPAPQTLVHGVRKLLPGHLLRVLPDGTVHEERWWALPTAGDQVDLSDDAATDALDAALRASVDTAVVADVPVGAYLSGGLDSSLIVALMSRLGAGPVKTFSAGFTDSGNDELPHARRVSALLGTHHHEVLVSPDDFQSLWHQLTWHRDAPLSQPADVAVFRLAEQAAQEVKVVLSGEGADELFGGYPKHRAARWVELASVLPAGLRQTAAKRAEDLLPYRAGRLRVPLRALASGTAGDRMRSWFAPFDAVERQRLLGDHVELPYPPWATAEGDLLRRMLHVDCHGWLSDNLLERGDRMSMAASVELRPPFLGRDVVDLAFRLPSSVKVRGGEGKWLVRQVARRYLPHEVVARRKVGFEVPLQRWFRNELADLARDLLCSDGGFVANSLDRGAVRNLLDRHTSGRSDESRRIWTLLSLEIWHETTIRGLRAGGVAA